MNIFEIIIFSILGILVLVAVLISLPEKHNIVSKLIKYYENKEAKQFPEFIEKLRIFEATCQCTADLAVLMKEEKRELDNLLVKVNYLPQKEKEPFFIKLEKAKEKYYSHEKIYEEQEKILQEQREEVERERKRLGIKWN